jgi:hypothetical protein
VRGLPIAGARAAANIRKARCLPNVVARFCAAGEKLVGKHEDRLTRICNVLLASVGKSALWREGQPTTKALSLRNSSGGMFAAEERVMLLLAWAVWDGGGGLKLADVLKTLSPQRLALVGALLSAMAAGPEAMDTWLAQHERPGSS